jgi:hypothetical protein
MQDPLAETTDTAAALDAALDADSAPLSAGASESSGAQRELPRSLLERRLSKETVEKEKAIMEKK